jgi:hypothetical protein
MPSTPAPHPSSARSSLAKRHWRFAPGLAGPLLAQAKVMKILEQHNSNIGAT